MGVFVEGGEGGVYSLEDREMASFRTEDERSLRVDVMPVMDLQDWISEYAKPGHLWFAKRLSGNDTGLTGSHQDGPLIAKSALFAVLPSLNNTSSRVTDARLELFTDSHTRHDQARAVWYWSKTEGRLTRVGRSESPFLDPENTGELAVFVFALREHADSQECHAWVCGNDGRDAELIEEIIGPVEPKSFVIWRPGSTAPQGELFSRAANCDLAQSQIPAEWLDVFPSGEQIIHKTLELRNRRYRSVDERLEARRQCEFEIFKSVERVFWLPRIRQDFDLDSFIALAQSILQSRKARAGNSLELHARQIFIEESFRPDVDFQHRPVTESGKKPDFIFPSQSAYEDNSFPAERLRMLAAKTTCKDRWRQVLDEANRIPIKHLLTLQEGVSETQFRQMNESGIKLVVPKRLHAKYPESIRPHILSLENFIAEIRLTLV